MKDLIRNYKMNIKRRMSVDSDNESTPLASSANSSSSFGAVQCMFPDSDTTDTDENKQRDVPIQMSPVTPKSLIRRPFCYTGSHFESPTFDVFHYEENVYDKYQLYSKLNGSNSESDLPDKDIPTVSSVIESHETQTSLVTIFSIWNTMMGTSLLTMGWGLAQANLFPGVAAILLIGLITLYTAYCVIKVNEEHGVNDSDVSQLCRQLLGRWAEIIAKIFSVNVLIGANIVYWILMSNFLYTFVVFIYESTTGTVDPADNITSPNAVICPKEAHLHINLNDNSTSYPLEETMFHKIWDLNRTVPLFLALILYPLLNFKHVTFFTKFNSVGTLSVMYLMIFVAVKGVQWGPHLPDMPDVFKFKPSFTAITGVLAMSYFIHNIIIALMKNNRDQTKNGRDLSIAFGLVIFTYTFIGTVFYITFPLNKSCIEDNLLNNFTKKDTLSVIARVLLLFQLITVFPLISFMLRLEVLQIVKIVCKRCGVTAGFSYWKVMILNFVVVVICILFACFLPRIGTLIRYTGAMSGLVHIFSLPCLLKMVSLRKEEKLSPFKVTMYVFIMVFGFINLTSQFFIQEL